MPMLRMNDDDMLKLYNDFKCRNATAWHAEHAAIFYQQGIYHTTYNLTPYLKYSDVLMTIADWPNIRNDDTAGISLTVDADRRRFH